MDTRTYVRLDDHLPENPKIIKAGEEAEVLYIHGLAYCSRQMTDGRIPKAIVPRLVAKNADKKATRLVENDLWIDHGDEYEIKDYLLHQRSREQIENERRKARERAAKSRRTSQGSWQEVRQPEAEALSEAKSEAHEAPFAPTNGAKEKQQDEIWDALVSAFGAAPETKTERGAWNKAAKELRDVGAQPFDIRKRVGEFKARYTGATCTPMALVKHWGALGTQASRYVGPANQAPVQIEPDPACEHSNPICDDCKQENLRRLATMREQIGARP